MSYSDIDKHVIFSITLKLHTQHTYMLCVDNKIFLNNKHRILKE